MTFIEFLLIVVIAFLYVITRELRKMVVSLNQIADAYHYEEYEDEIYADEITKYEAYNTTNTQGTVADILHKDVENLPHDEINETNLTEKGHEEYSV